ncbi:hydrolase [Mycolicibacterium goodii]|uniref:Hydrolase n=1 Tax=Mycolicibacterium goodii TaxID=134601 RepID=A0A0K0X6G4_MYCGD|nr:hydrolase [Mycolicibacterium goodii]
MPSDGRIWKGDRALAYREVGDPHGHVVLHNHGGPSSRLEVDLFDSAARAKGLRFIGIDRPGIGESDSQSGRTFRGWAEDLVAMADSLGAHRFAVLGWSEGGPWALAGAAYLDPDRLVHVSTIGGGSYGTFGPNWAARYLNRADAIGGSLAVHFRPGFRLMYALLGLSATRFGGSYRRAVLKSVSAADRTVLADDAVMTRFLATSRECFRQGSGGLVVDATLLYEAWPFDVRDVTRPVHFWQGTDDTLVPEVINRTVADAMPGAVWHPVEGGGHFIAVSHADEILALVADAFSQ